LSAFLEIACFNLNSCSIAEKAGVNRIEFCSDYNSGGITPVDKDIIEIKKKINLPVHVIIRPRGGNFVFTEKEFNEMKRSILLCKHNNIDGVVFGILNANQTINELQCKELIELAKPMKTVFHRAIDQVSNIEKGIQKLIELNFEGVLTSGGKDSALSGIENLKKIQSTYGDKIQIIAGGGIRSTNIDAIKSVSGCKFFHSAAIIGENETANENEIIKLKSQLA
jgi:copper homeostasis protein